MGDWVELNGLLQATTDCWSDKSDEPLILVANKPGESGKCLVKTYGVTEPILPRTLRRIAATLMDLADLHDDTQPHECLSTVELEDRRSK